MSDILQTVLIGFGILVALIVAGVAAVFIFTIREIITNRREMEEMNDRIQRRRRRRH